MLSFGTQTETASFTPAMESVSPPKPKNTLEMVKQAIAHKNVRLAYQPVVRTNNPDEPAFYEGLIRILDKQRQVIPAKDFILDVETLETGRIIDCLALEMGLQELAEQPNLRISINMSARSIGYPRWMKVLNAGLALDETIAERLILEITESSAMIMPEIVQCFMKDLQNRGICFALDDFGSGYTAFRYFRDFQFDIVKIDGQFIRNIDTDADNQVLTNALVDISRQFDMFTVAEHVETEAELAILQSMGVDCVQGYLTGRPEVVPSWQAGKVPLSAYI